MTRLSRPAAIAVLGVGLVLATPVPSPAQATSAVSQDASTSLTFRQVLELATSQNLELAAVRRGRAVREAEVRTASQWANPEFSADVTRDTPHGDLAISFPLDIGGTRSKRIALAKAGLAMADVDEANALRQVRRDVRLAFYGVLATDQQVALAEETVVLAQRVTAAAQARFDEGAAPRMDVMQAELGAARATAGLELARSERRAARAELNALLNRPPGSALTLAGRADDTAPAPTLERATAAALAGNIDLLTLEREAAIETGTRSLLRAERVPTPSFSFGTALNAPNEFTVGPHAGISLTIPLFSRNQGELAGSAARSSTIAARRDAARRQVEARVFAALERVAAQQAQVAAFQQTLLPTATALQDLAEESYRLGRDSILVALDAQRSLRDVKSEYVQALLNLQAAIADLEDILGGPIL